MLEAVRRAPLAVPPLSTAAFSSAVPDSSPDAATRSSPARECAPVCDDESIAAADLSVLARAPRSAENDSPPATATTVARPACRASAAVHRWLESSQHRQSTLHALVSPAAPKTTDSFQ